MMTEVKGLSTPALHAIIEDLRHVRSDEAMKMKESVQAEITTL